ncbi:MAG: hypothetical protein JSR98_04740 [Proteobacteria bacterium]|nr:hypothetical protein [Pseudomonadota bacterium]
MRFALILALGTALAGPALAAAAEKAPAVDPSVRQPGWKSPKNAFGQPDLSGYWSNATMTPTVRNLSLTKEAVLPDAQAKQAEAAFADALAKADAPTKADEKPTDAKADEEKLIKLRPEFAAAGGDVGGYNAFWLDPGGHLMRVNGQYRTSLITTPDGQIPKPKAAPAGAGGRRQGLGSFDNPENRSLGERCVIGFGRNAGPPMLPNGFYNNNYEILQTANSVAIDVEMVHDVRIIRLDSHHRTDGVRPWFGDAIGHYEGDTLVVETTNIPQAENLYGSWKNLKITEWFTRISPTRILYRFQAEDPDTWDKPWGGEYEFSPLKGIVYEYACHEGNYALPGMLAGARRAEQAAASGQAKPGAE